MCRIENLSLKAQVELLERENQLLRAGLVHIVKHMELVGGTLSNQSTVTHIANCALGQKGSSPEGGGG